MAEKINLGKIVLFGSGEISATGRTIHDRLLAELPSPVTVAILETPAGFQPNSEYVAGEVGEFFKARLKNYYPQVHIIPARKKGTPFSPDDPEILEPLLSAHYIFLGPGSPTYAVKNLSATLALKYLIERQKEGAYLCFASAATLAVGAKVLPVYEIFKAGADPYWVDGLNILGQFGLELAVVPHWNNKEGGAHLDTSHCFMGERRFQEIKELLPPSVAVLGIDEHTAVIFDFQCREGLVRGKGTITIDSQDGAKVYTAGQSFALAELGPYRLPAELVSALPTRRKVEKPTLTEAVARMISVREEARQSRDWSQADALRQQLSAMGYEIQDTNEGPLWRLKGEPGPARPITNGDDAV